MRRVSLLAIIPLVAFLACDLRAGASAETRVLDLRHHLPAGVEPPAESAAREHRVQVTVGPDSIAMALRWRTFAVGQAQYLLSAMLDIPAETEGSTIVFAESRNPINMGSADAVLEALPLTIAWDKSGGGRTRMGTVAGTIVADGRWLQN
jgi:hypothetical protein